MPLILAALLGSVSFLAVVITAGTVYAHVASRNSAYQPRRTHKDR